MGSGDWKHNQSPRIYRVWAGNERGTPENVLNCIADVPDKGRSVLSGQCSRKRGKGLDGLYCTIHARRWPATGEP